MTFRSALTPLDGATSEVEFAAQVDACAGDGARLLELLDEGHAVYDQRGAAATVRMRGWVLLALARCGAGDEALVFLLEELDTGTDAYLVAAAARALRGCAKPGPALAPFVMRALGNIRYHDDLVSFDGYGAYVIGSEPGTSPVRELLATLAWLGPHARSVLAEVEALGAARGGLPRKLQDDVRRAVAAIQGGNEPAGSCCELPAGLGRMRRGADARRRGESEEEIVFEDQDGRVLRFGEFFRGRPAIAAFFYTRCDNPLKCSLTVAKLARVQKLLEERGLAGAVRTAAITYDPGFDLAERLKAYGRDRGLRMDDDHRMLRATAGAEAVRAHFELGVNFIESLVNRHRVELYVLDAEGRVAASFTRLHWDEQEVVDCAAEAGKKSPARAGLAGAGALAPVALALLPKCPVCWTAYLSMFGIAGAVPLQWTGWVQPVLWTLLAVNAVSVWLRARALGRWWPAYLVGAGAIAIATAKWLPGASAAAMAGAALTMAGSIWSVTSLSRRPQPPAARD